MTTVRPAVLRCFSPKAEVPFCGHATVATLTSVDPYVEPVGDPALPPRIAYAGARHLVLAAATRERLADLDYDFDRLERYMTARDLTTVQLVWCESAGVFHVRDPFPVGGVVEDPVTGAAAAAFGAYLRELGELSHGVLTLHQGDDLGRPGLVPVELREGDPRVRVSGHAAPIPA